MSQVVDARLPDPLKEALAEHASARALSLTAALVELLEQGLAASAAERSLAGLERELALAGSELAETRGRLREAELGLQAARERDELTARSYRALAERTRQQLASCPRCRKPVRGCDLLVSGHCPHCSKPLSSLLTRSHAVGSRAASTSLSWGHLAPSSASRWPAAPRTRASGRVALRLLCDNERRLRPGAMSAIG
ncbi:MAG: hypothetical protein AABM30_03440 [Actinomycetota bacterium]